ncbi:MAG: hypothetical protein PHH73_00255 [Candidatus Rickettsiella isopodorum]|nr:hypothetical protein [Candidatus Rickettsiella isopodorum]
MGNKPKTTTGKPVTELNISDLEKAKLKLELCFKERKRIYEEIGIIFGVRIFLDESLPDDEWAIISGKNIYRFMMEAKNETENRG